MRSLNKKRKPERRLIMRKFIPALSLTLTLGLTAIGDTAPRTAQPTPSHLTASEEVCLHLGGIAHSSAIMQAKGLSYLEALQHLRKVVDANATPGAVVDWFTTNAFIVLRFVYERPSFSPAEARQIAELACVQQIEQGRPTLTKERY
jgi:hypothetical protein